MSPEQVVTVTRYEVSCLPEEHRDRRHFTVRVQHTGYGAWVVGRDDEWYGPQFDPRERPVEMDLVTALKVANVVAPLMVVNGRTVADVLAHEGGQ
ncbi:hypothetical protein [Nocardia sp. NBC_01327]|uniref:hypothetical protein n=1 Tax=Nocardia sp. NBC_01327 TaxID=2903593 RepID=UPI002E12B6A8|nr:hypothetical protein OG326_24215 [Nocardia sp. NBC_01327]